MRSRYRNPAQRLRTTVERLPERTRRAMLDGIERNRIIVGAYTDPRSGGICPMLAAHRNGGRTDLATFALAWDAFTGARRPRLATRREVRTLRSFLEQSMLEESTHSTGSIAAAAAQIRAERAELAKRDAAEAVPSDAAAPEIRIRRLRGDGELRDRVRAAWMRPSRRRDEFSDVIEIAEAELAGAVPAEPARG